MPMRLFWNAAIAAIFAALTTLTPQAGCAAIIENIFLRGTDNLVGTISLPAISGANAAGVDLSFQSSAFLPEFTEADITFIQWALDPVDFAVLDLDLNAFQGDNPCPNGRPCSNFQLQLFTTPFSNLFSETGVECAAVGGCLVIDVFPTAIDYRVAVPEAGGLAILAIGLIAMGIALWADKAKRPPRPIYAVGD